MIETHSLPFLRRCFIPLRHTNRYKEGERKKHIVTPCNREPVLKIAGGNPFVPVV